jgi:hypothetical protein
MLRTRRKQRAGEDAEDMQVRMQSTGEDAEYRGRMQSTGEDAEDRGRMQMTEEDAEDRIYTYGKYYGELLVLRGNGTSTFNDDQWCSPDGFLIY